MALISPHTRRWIPSLRGFARLVLRAIVTQRDEASRYQLAEVLLYLLCPAENVSEQGRTFCRDAAFLAWYERYVERFSRRSLDRKYTIDQLLKLAVLVDGDTAECGAYEGAASHLICSRIAGTGRRHRVFDSFAGLSEPDEVDGGYWRPGSMASPEEVIRENLAAFDFVDYYKGWIPDRFDEVADARFCFVHVDVDLFQPTFDAVAFFYERLNPGGLLLCDDYGFATCPGARQAMDEFFADKPEPVLDLPTGQGLVIKR